MSKQNQNVKKEMHPKNMGELQPTGPFNTMYRCRQCSRQHRSTRAAGINDDISTPGGRWISHGGGGTSSVDAPRPKIILRTNFQPRSREHHAEIISNSLRFGSHAGKQRPANVGAVVVVRLLALYRESVRLCCRASYGLCTVYGSPDVIS